uniref:Myosin heavy chain 95F (inferred by orthology to a D. melanogaster protein) n=1 Tax=Strongyloides venezuelensis TaxID=75913 RepID=A0A0K0F6T6_STRVS
MEESIIASSALEGFKLIVPDNEKGFVIGIFESFTNDKTIQLKIEGSNESKQFPLSQTYTPNSEVYKDFDDNCMMDSPNLATLFLNIKDRFFKNKIYTYVSTTLIAVNPYKQIYDLYTGEMIKKYYNNSYALMPPHIYAIANKALNNIKLFNKDQTIILSGESGSGKTEAQKEILNFIFNTWESNNKLIERKILYSNLILESFGNAMTVGNKNSSRFVKYISINFDNGHKVIGGKIIYHLLERSRIIYQSKHERNYHIFYQFILGANDKWREEFNVSKIEQFEYLSKGCQSILNYGKDCIIDDVNSYGRLIEALKEIGYNYNNIKEIFKILSGILHLGNIKFYQKTNDGECDVENEDSLKHVSLLYGFESDMLKNALASKRISLSGNSTNKDPILIHLKCTEAVDARNALAKKIYTRLFDNIVSSINDKIKTTSIKYHSLSVLDIAGFGMLTYFLINIFFLEFCKINCFEQLCINYTNEKLRNFFNKIIFINDQKLFDEENIFTGRINFTENNECLQLFDSKFDGIFALLKEETYLPQPSPIHFTESVFSRNNKNINLTTGKEYNMKGYKDNEGFVIRHYANDVFYDTKNFIAKDNDILHSSLEDFLQQSTNIYFKHLFNSKNLTDISKQNSPTISLTYKRQLDELLREIEFSGIHFIQCIKPNDLMNSNIFDSNKVIKQLSCSVINDALFMMNVGFPYKIDMNELYQRYEEYLNGWMKKIDRRVFLDALFNVFKLDKKMYKFGVTKIFFEKQTYEKFDKLLKREKIVVSTNKVKCRLHNKKWKKIIFSIIFTVNIFKNFSKKNNAAIIIQAYVKGFLLRKKVKKILEIYNELCNFSEIIDRNMEMIENFSSKRKKSLCKRSKDVLTLIIVAKSCCKKLNYKKVHYLVKDHNEISYKLFKLLSSIENVILEDELNKQLEIDEKYLDEHHNLKCVGEGTSTIFEDKQKHTKKYKKLNDSINKVKNIKNSIICNFVDDDFYNIYELEEKLLNDKIFSKIDDVSMEIQIYDEEELKKMSFKRLKQNLDTLIDKRRRDQCKEEIERRYSQLKKRKITQK